MRFLFMEDEPEVLAYIKKGEKKACRYYTSQGLSKSGIRKIIMGSFDTLMALWKFRPVILKSPVILYS